MPYTGTDWANSDPTMVRPYTYDFTNRLPSGDTIVSVTWTLEVFPVPLYAGSDPSPASKLSTPSFSGTTATIWAGPGLVAGVRYRLTAFIQSEMGISDDLFSYISVDPTP